MDRDGRPGEESGRGRILNQIEAVWRIDAPRIIAALTRYTGDFALAEDVVQEALSEAVAKWPGAGLPKNPAAWLTTTAKRRAIDTWRRRERLTEREALLAVELQRNTNAAADEPLWDPETITDDVLRLVMIACHPVLNRPSQLALTLRVVGGLTTEQIARALLTSRAAIQQRIVRAKRTLAAAQVPFELPPAREWDERLAGVLGVLYLLFSEGHTASSGPQWLRPHLALDALRITRIVSGLMPREPEVHGLVGLMALTAARFPARTGTDGEPVLLADQDRSRWDRSLIRLGERSTARAEALRARRGYYTLQASIARTHARAASVDQTDWASIVADYDDLLAVADSPIVALNRAIAVAEAYGPARGLALVEDLASAGVLAESHYLPSVRGELLARLGRIVPARREFLRAAELATNDAVRGVLLTRVAALDGASTEDGE